ncbi:PrpR N-terminal domain-containing protein [Caldibacillus thermoamylovorans]|nr:PrpR N-terminal domain-containing protein [Caldibacillus thermoamylovorans]
MNKIRVLGIAPFEYLLLTMKQIASKFEDLYFEGFVGDLYEGVALAKEKEEDFDIIISRGGTAQLLRKEVNIPTIEIEVSVFDILHAIKLAENFREKYAIIGFSNITKPAHTIAELLGIDLDIITINDQNEVGDVIRNLKKNNFDLIIGDQITSRIAAEYELNSILILSGEESTMDAFNNAIVIARYSYELKEKIDFHSKFQKALEYYTFIFNKNYELVFQSGGKNSPTLLNHLILNLKSRHLQENNKQISYEKYYGKLYEVECILKNSFIYISLKPVNTNIPSRSITLTNDNGEKENSFEELINSSYLVGNNKNIVTMLSRSKKPILLIGEVGTGKEKTARMLHRKFKNKRLWKINAGELSPEEFDILFFSDQSIFLDSDSTFYICHIELLSNKNLNLVLDYITHSQPFNNNWILSYTKNLNNQPKKNSPLQTFDCNIINLYSLRERKQDIGPIISIYINSLNYKYGKQIIGLEPSALQILIEYDWPQNLLQLKRVLEELFLITKTSYINQKSVRMVLENEGALSSITSPAQNTSRYDNLSLKEITHEIVKEALKKNDGNQTKTAKELKISRSTLWRILRDDL